MKTTKKLSQGIFFPRRDSNRATSNTWLLTPRHTGYKRHLVTVVSEVEEAGAWRNVYNERGCEEVGRNESVAQVGVVGLPVSGPVSLC